MTAYELRQHLADDHDVRLSGLDYATLLTIHDDVHRRAPAGHEHDDGPGSAGWERECREFGCLE